MNNNLQYKFVKSSQVKTLGISGGGKFVDITWSDGHVSQYHSMWLRHNCHCSKCKLDSNSMVKIDFNQIDLSVKVEDVALEGDAVLVVQWSSQDGEKSHKGMLPLPMLRASCYSGQADQERRQQRAMKFSKDKTMPRLDYNEIVASEKGLYRWLSALSERGLCLLTNVPCVLGTVIKAAQHIAPIQHTVYGEIFDVKNTVKPINAAYSGVKLPMHMDQIFYESPPGLQFLHCIKFDSSVTGGENTFVDIHEAAHQLRQERPDFFDTLAGIPTVFQTLHYDREYPVHLKMERKIFNLNDKDELVAVFWHPMLAGPLNIPADKMEAYYEAYKYFYTLVNERSEMYEIRLQEGELISFNNRRILHGRQSFDNQTGERLLQGTYVEISEFHSRLQVLHNKLGDGRLATRPGSLDLQ